MGVKTDLGRLARALAGFDGRSLAAEAAQFSGNRLKEIVQPVTPREKGDLRAGWSVRTPEATVRGAAVLVENGMDYASYVEYGHRQQDGRFVPGQFFLRSAEQAYRNEGGRALDALVERRIRQVMKGDQ